MKFDNHSLLVSVDALLDDKMQIIANRKVLTDSDACELFQIDLMHLKRILRNNSDRFPEDFMLTLTKKEITDEYSRFGRRRKIYAFTWGGLMMLAGIVNTRRAIRITHQLYHCYGDNLLEKIQEVLNKEDEK